MTGKWRLGRSRQCCVEEMLVLHFLGLEEIAKGGGLGGRPKLQRGAKAQSVTGRGYSHCCPGPPEGAGEMGEAVGRQACTPC